MTKYRNRTRRRRKRGGTTFTFKINNLFRGRKQTRKRSNATTNHPHFRNLEPYSAEKYRYFLSGYKQSGEPCEKYYDLFPMHSSEFGQVWPAIMSIRMNHCRLINHVVHRSTDDDVDVRLLEFVSEIIENDNGDIAEDATEEDKIPNIVLFQNKVSEYITESNYYEPRIRPIDYFVKYNEKEKQFHIFISEKVLHLFSIIATDNFLVEEMPIEPSSQPTPTVFLFLNMHGQISQKNIQLGSVKNISNPESVVIFSPVLKNTILWLTVRFFVEALKERSPSYELVPLSIMYETIRYCLSKKKKTEEILDLCCYLQRNVFLEKADVSSRRDNDLYQEKYEMLSNTLYNNTKNLENHIVQNTPGYHTYFHDKLYYLFDDRLLNRVEVIGLYHPDLQNKNQREFNNRNTSVPYDLRDKIPHLKSRNISAPLKLSNIIEATRVWFGIQNVVIFDYCCWETTNAEYIRKTPQKLANHVASVNR